MHTGVLFLFPHVANICLAAAECNTTSFPSWGPHAFECPSSSNPEDPHPPFMQV